ncbi:MAG: hypothetical protein ACU833_01885 [Gammaproteobacteria bacterium]
MRQFKDYLPDRHDNVLAAIVAGIDRDVERGEDVLMLGLGAVMLSSFFAPVAPPSVLLPLVALTFAFSAGVARINYYRMEGRFLESLEKLERGDRSILFPIYAAFAENPAASLAESFNPIKNLKRTGKSALGGFLINPLWMPIFYMMGMQINEEKKLGFLNRAIIDVEGRIAQASWQAFRRKQSE